MSKIGVEITVAVMDNEPEAPARVEQRTPKGVTEVTDGSVLPQVAEYVFSNEVASNGLYSEESGDEGARNNCSLQ